MSQLEDLDPEEDVPIWARILLDQEDEDAPPPVSTPLAPPSLLTQEGLAIEQGIDLEEVDDAAPFVFVDDGKSNEISEQDFVEQLAHDVASIHGGVEERQEEDDEGIADEEEDDAEDWGDEEDEDDLFGEDDLDFDDIEAIRRLQQQISARQGSPDGRFANVGSHTQNQYDLLAAVRKPDASAELLERTLRESKSQLVQWAVLAHPNCSEEMLEQAARQFSDDDVKLLIVASNPSCPAGTLGAMARMANADTMMAIINNPNCPDPLRQSQLKEMDPHQRQQLVRNPAASEQLLIALQDDPQLRSAVMGHPNYPQHLRMISNL